MRVEADAFADGHDVIVCQLLHRYADEKTWHQSTMRALGNDRWQGEFRVEQMGRYAYTVVAWADAFLTWRGALAKRKAAAQDLAPEFRSGAHLLADCAARAGGSDKEALLAAMAALDGNATDEEPSSARMM